MTLTLAPGTLVVLVGVSGSGSGSGKTTFPARYPSSCVICLDAYRQMATDSLSAKFSVLAFWRR